MILLFYHRRLFLFTVFLPLFLLQILIYFHQFLIDSIFPMTAKNFHIIGKFQLLKLFYGIFSFLFITCGMFCTAYEFRHYGIPAKQYIFLFKVKYTRAAGMPRRMYNFKCISSDCICTFCKSQRLCVQHQGKSVYIRTV